MTDRVERVGGVLSPAVFVMLVGTLLLSACTSSRSPTAPVAPKPSAEHGSSIAAMISDDHYRVYTGDGEPATLEDVIESMEDVSVAFVGESHDDVVGHRLKMMLLASAYRAFGSERQVALSLEMFSRDVQYIVDEYLDSLITERHFLASSNPWPNYASDYRPLVEFARAHGLPVLAANAPRRYVNRVARLGPASLADVSDEALDRLPPLPYPGPSPEYTEKWDRLMTEGAHGMDAEEASPASADGVSNMLHAQALWDAAMAYSLSEFLEEKPDALVLHVAGSFHVAGGTGTPEALEHYRPGASTVTVILEPTNRLGDFPADERGAGDFVILTLAGESSGRDV